MNPPNREQASVAIDVFRKAISKHIKGWNTSDFSSRMGELVAMAEAIGHLEGIKTPGCQFDVTQIAQSLIKSQLTARGIKILKILSRKSCRPMDLAALMEEQFSNFRNDIEWLKGAGYIDKFRTPSHRINGWKEYIKYEITVNGRLALKKHEATERGNA